MFKGNFHTHSRFCDGVGEPDEYVTLAVRKGFQALGFSGHAPLPYPNDWTMKAEQVPVYLEQVNRLKRENEGAIRIYTGLEIDYFPEDNWDILKKYRLDYIIGSVHCIVDYQRNICHGIDGSREEFEAALALFQGDIRRFAGNYYDRIARMAREMKPDIIGHFDIFKKNNADGHYFSETDDWYIKLVKQALAAIAASGRILEINTGGRLRGYIPDFYPSRWILGECRKLEIPVILSSDAHQPENLDGYFEEARLLLKEAGYLQQRVLHGNEWIDVAL